MNSLMAIIIVSFCFVVSGWYVSYFHPTALKIERLGLAFLLGAGTTTFTWFIAYRLGLPLNLSSFVLSTAINLGIGYILSQLCHLKITHQPAKPLGKLEKYLIYTIILLLVSAFIIGSYNPLTAWDAIALYDFRGHAIAISHNLTYFSQLSYYISYPLMTSLTHAAIYMLGADSAQGIYAIIFASFIAIIYGRMSEWVAPKYALITCLLIILQNEIFAHATFAYTNLTYTAYLIVGFLYAVSRGKYSLMLSGLLFGLSTWVRSAEVFWIAALILLLYEGIKSKHILTAILGSVLIFTIRYGWNSYTAIILKSLSQPVESLTTHIGLSTFTQIIHNLPAITVYIYQYLVSPYLIIWFLVIPISLVALKFKDHRLFSLLGSLFVCIGLVVVGVMIFSTYYSTWDQIGDSAKRMILFVIPHVIILAVYSLALISKDHPHDK